MVAIIVVSSFCITTIGVKDKCEATIVSYSDDILYSATAVQSIDSETINYNRKEIISYKINESFPDYYNTNTSINNTCANVAGANIIGFYDRYYDDLIPNYTTGIQRANGYTYYPMTLNADKKQSVINILYNTMETNTKSDGTSKDDCIKGLRNYVQVQGRSINYTSVMANGLFNLDKFDNELRNGNPVMFFLSGYNFVSITDTGSQAIIDKSIYMGNHIVVAYGYQKINYYNTNNNLVKSNTYIEVSTGIKNVKGYYLLNNGGNMDAAEAVTIN